jgi:hypothetical protein
VRKVSEIPSRYAASLVEKQQIEVERTFQRLVGSVLLIGEDKDTSLSHVYD